MLSTYLFEEVSVEFDQLSIVVEHDVNDLQEVLGRHVNVAEYPIHHLGDRDPKMLRELDLVSK